MTRQDLENNNSQNNLLKLKNQTSDRIRAFFAEHLKESETYIAAYIFEKLKNSPFEECRISDRQMRRWISGESAINRFGAYQICIALKWSSDIFEEFFKKLGIDFVRFNDWREVVYFYCIEKGHDLNKTYELFNRCIDIGLDESTGESKISPPATIMTDTIKDVYYLKPFINDADFMNFMKEQKHKFHKIRNTRHKEVIEYLEIIKEKLTGVGDTIPQRFSSAFYLNDDPDKKNLRDDFNYFSTAITAIRKKRKNFSREFFILCLLISEKSNNVDEISAILTTKRRDYPDLDPENNLFDACVYEACKYHERTKAGTAYDRFCENTALLEYERPSRFAYD